MKKRYKTAIAGRFRSLLLWPFGHSSGHWSAGLGSLGLVAGDSATSDVAVHAFDPGILARIRQPVVVPSSRLVGASVVPGRGHWCNIRVLITGGPAAADLPRKTGPSRPEGTWRPSCVTANISIPYPRKTKASFAMHASSRLQNGAGIRLDR
jgi:hypothetical protein